MFVTIVFLLIWNNATLQHVPNKLTQRNYCMREQHQIIEIYSELKWLNSTAYKW